ncbi:MAG: hypothetical protein AB1813_12490 [Verrucomicrobiota bacterium]
MKKLIIIGLCCLLNVGAADALQPDSDGYIRHWLLLAPIALAEGETGSEAIFKEQIKDEATLRPKAGDKLKIGGKELTWKAITATTNYFDFAASVNTLGEKEAGYAVTYIECETEKPDVIMAVASNDQGRIYLNGVDIYVWSEPRTLTLDSEKGRVTLKKGVNVIVFKVINEQGNWQGAMRLLDKAGAPLKDLKIKSTP